MAGGIRFFSASFMRSLSCGKIRDFWPRNRALARNPAFSGAKGVQQAAKSQVGKNDERQKGSGAPRRVPERGFVAKNARFCCTIEKGARKWSKDAHPKRETTRMEGTASKRCANACCTPNAWSHPKAPTRPATDPPRHRPCIAEERGRSQAALPCSQTVLPRSQAAQRPPRQAPRPPRQRSASTVPVAALPPCSRLVGCKAAFSRRRRGRGVSREAICTHSHTDATAS